MLWQSPQLVNNFGRDRTDLRSRHRPLIGHSACEDGEPPCFDPSVITNDVVRDPEQPRQRRIALRHIHRSPTERPDEHLGCSVFKTVRTETACDVAGYRRSMAPVQLRERIGITDRLPQELGI